TPAVRPSTARRPVLALRRPPTGARPSRPCDHLPPEVSRIPPPSHGDGAARITSSTRSSLLFGSIGTARRRILTHVVFQSRRFYGFPQTRIALTSPKPPRLPKPFKLSQSRTDTQPCDRERARGRGARGDSLAGWPG